MIIEYLIPSERDTDHIQDSIDKVIKQTNNTMLDASFLDYSKPMEEIYSKVADHADLYIANLTNNDGDVALELGFALGRNKPAIILCEQQDLDIVNPDLFSCISIIYNKQRIQETLIKPLTEYLKSNNLEKYLQKQKSEIVRKKETKTIFVSYSHVDINYLERLNVHIKPFEKSGLIDFWSDKKIGLGEKWKEKITAALDRAAIAILLISSDFLASDFIIENELPPLIKSAEERGTLILPVIVKPCRFAKNKALSIFQSVNDPNLPLSKMDESQREDVYVKICDYIDNLVS